jgi:probable HAF family extracellular repeat protein
MIRRQQILVGLSSVILGGAGPERMPCAYEPLVVPFPRQVIAHDINNHSEACGYHWFISSSDDARPFYWSRERGIVTLPLPPGFLAGIANGISDDGDVVGFGWYGETVAHAMLWRNGQVVDLGLLPGSLRSEAYAVANGRAVGVSLNHHVGPLRAAFWDSTGIHAIDPPIGPNSEAYDVNAMWEMCGWMGGSPNQNSNAFLVEGDRLLNLGTIPGGFTGYATAINAVGDMAISGRIMIDGVPRIRSFLWREGQFVDLGVLPECHTTYAYDLNSSGAVVGLTLADIFGPGGPIIWHNGRMSLLGDLITPPPPGQPFHGVSPPYAINERWEITGGASNSYELAVLIPVFGSPADLTGDCSADKEDLAILLNDWGASGSPADFDGNGAVNVTDLLFLLAHWGTGGGP